MKDKKSLLNWGILVVIAVVTAVYLLNEAEKAILEIGALAFR